MKVQEFNKENLRQLREEMQAAIAKVEKSMGIKIHVGNISFSGNEANIKVKANVIGQAGRAITKEAQQFGKFAAYEGIENFKVGDQVQINGQILIIKGYNSRARKAPLILEGLNGKGYKAPIGILRGKAPIK